MLTEAGFRQLQRQDPNFGMAVMRIATRRLADGLARTPAAYQGLVAPLGERDLALAAITPALRRLDRSLRHRLGYALMTKAPLDQNIWTPRSVEDTQALYPRLGRRL